jgi:hypothetical protein
MANSSKVTAVGITEQITVEVIDSKTVINALVMPIKNSQILLGLVRRIWSLNLLKRQVTLLNQLIIRRAANITRLDRNNRHRIKTGPAVQRKEAA